MAHVHVLAPVHNRRALTERFARCLKAQTYPRLRLVLIDDGSTDGTAEAVSALLPSTTVLRGDGTLWWGGSLQRGFEHLHGGAAAPDDLVLIMNDDVVFEPDFVDKGVAALLREPRSLLLAQLHDAASGRYLESGVHLDWRSLRFHPVQRAEEINCFSTRGLFLRYADMLQIGGFRPILLPHYHSDYEYTMRARRKGFRLATSPEVRLRGHEDEHTTGVRTTEGMPIGKFLRVIFTRRALHNPFYWSSFVLLSCPWRYLPLSLARVWWRFFRQATRAVFASGKP